MANAIERLQLRGIKRQEALLGNPVFVFGVEVACVPSSVERGSMIEVAGNAELVGVSLTYRVEEFEGGAEPTSGQKVTYQEEEHRVLFVKYSADGSHATLVCADPNSNRRR